MDTLKDIIGAQMSGIERDTIGEIMNISMGAAATAVSTLLDRQVNITTPQVAVIEGRDFECKSLEPALGIEIQYVEGLSGSNYMIMRRRDIRAIVDLLLSGETMEESDEALDEIYISAVSEIMNQMMGSSSTALASFFGKGINISTPKTFDPDEIKGKFHLPDSDELIVTVTFSLKVEGLIDSEFITILPVEFTKELVRNALNFGEEPPMETAPQQPQIEMEIHHEPFSERTAEMNQREEQTVRTTPAPRGGRVSVQPLKLQSFDEEVTQSSQEPGANFNLILNVPLDITVEIGRARKPVQEILDIRQGSIVELDKQAGDPVDVIVNGQLFARGDVVVIDDNFGVRITEIVSNRDAIKFR